MAIKRQREEGTMTLSLKRAIASGTERGHLQEEVIKAVKGGCRKIILDASGVRFIDASRLGELVACRAIAKGAGATIRLRGAFGKVLDVIRITGLERLLVGSTGPVSGIHRHVA